MTTDSHEIVNRSSTNSLARPIAPITAGGVNAAIQKSATPLSTRLRKWNNIIHRDLGYFFSGTVIIYAISGLAVNHIDDWDPNFIVDRQEIQVEAPMAEDSVTRESVMAILQPIGEQSHYRSHDFPTPNKLKIYLDDGSVFVDLRYGHGEYETVRRRPLLYQANVLHLNPEKWWLVFSDVFAVGLIVISITGLFVLKGRKGITGRGAVLVGAGVVVPLLFLITI